MARSAKRQFLVTINFTSGITVTGYWAQLTGGASQVTPTKHWDGGTTKPGATMSNVTFSDLVLTRWYDPVRDQQLEAQCRSQIASQTVATISSTPTDGNLVPVATPTTWTGILKDCQGPEVDADSGDAATLRLSFEILNAVAQ